MNHPLRWYHHLTRQIACKVLGHAWKSSWRRVRDEEPSGWTKNKTGNPYFEYVASWHYKCRRCRRGASEGVHPWYKWYWWALGSFLRAWSIYATHGTPWAKGEPGYGYARTPWPVYLVGLFVAGPLFGFEQAWLGYLYCERDWPSLPGEVAAELHYRLSDWMERHTTHYAWLPPDSGDPSEIGLWVRSEDARRYRTDPHLRPRVYVYGDLARPAVYGAQTTVASIAWTAPPGDTPAGPTPAPA